MKAAGAVAGSAVRIVKPPSIDQYVSGYKVLPAREPWKTMDRVHESRPCRMVEQEPHYGTEQQYQLVRLSIDYNIPFFL